jgi:hypothetical protein
MVFLFFLNGFERQELWLYDSNCKPQAKGKPQGVSTMYY